MCMKCDEDRSGGREASRTERSETRVLLCFGDADRNGVGRRRDENGLCADG